jgi:hypothetical protein
VKTSTQEPDVVPRRPILVVLAAFVAITAACVWIVWAMQSCQLGELRGDAPAEPSRPVPPEVSAMETFTFTARDQGRESRDAAERWLGSYGWVDRDAGVVHIPIERAMELYLERRGASR